MGEARAHFCSQGSWSVAGAAELSEPAECQGLAAGRSTSGDRLAGPEKVGQITVVFNFRWPSMASTTSSARQMSKTVVIWCITKVTFHRVFMHVPSSKGA